MASANTRNVLRGVPGRLVKNPTDLTSASPHGGTELGVCRDVEFRPGIKTSRIHYEEYGGPVEVMIAGEEAMLACVLRTYDNDLITSLFHNVATGASTGDQIINGRVSGAGVNRAGYMMSNKAMELVFSPKAVDRHPMIVVYNAIPMVDETAALQLSIGEEWGLGVVFLCVPDEQGRTYSIGKRDDLSL